MDTVQKCINHLELSRYPIYSNDGLYFVFKKKLFSLDRIILEKMLILYPKILFIEEQRRNIRERTFHPKTSEIISEAISLIDELCPVMRERVKELDKI